jgi:hypothetical protein
MRRRVASRNFRLRSIFTISTRSEAPIAQTTTNAATIIFLRQPVTVCIAKSNRDLSIDNEASLLTEVGRILLASTCEFAGSAGRGNSSTTQRGERCLPTSKTCLTSISLQAQFARNRRKSFIEARRVSSTNKWRGAGAKPRRHAATEDIDLALDGRAGRTRYAEATTPANRYFIAIALRLRA